jgi:hypothetical protein
MKATNLLLLILLSTCFIYAGCKSSDQKSDDPVEAVVEKTEEMHEKMEEEIDRTAPPEIAAELWDLIHTEGYKEHWKMLPGKDAYYEGDNGNLVTTYVNDTAYKAIGNNEALPTGSIVVNENYDKEKTLETINVKYKLAGYDKEKDDWFVVTYDPDGKPVSYD